MSNGLRGDPAPFPRAAFDGSTVDRWTAVVAAHGPEVAVTDAAGSITFDQLDHAADVVAMALGSDTARGPSDDVVVVLAEHDARAIAAVLGVWMSGRVVVVLDPATPSERLHRLVRLSGAGICLAAPDLVTVARSSGVGQVVELGQLDWQGTTNGRHRTVGPDATAQVVFTSGSTGAPRGVVYSHRFLVHDAWLRRDADWSRPGDVVAVPLPLAYAGGFGACFGALLSGAAVDLRDPRTQGTARLLDGDPTVLVGTPSLLVALATHAPRDRALPPSLRLVLCTGERLPAASARSLLEVLPAHGRLVNVYGSSETGLVAAQPIDPQLLDEAATVPVGQLMPDKRLVLDPEARDERLVLASPFMATGYWGDPEATAETFRLVGSDPAVHTSDRVRRRPDGGLELTGRLGLTVKVNGYRVEPAEVEAELLRLANVRDAVVVGHEHRPGVTRLAAYVVFDEGRSESPARVRQRLRDRLPAFMVPDLVIPVADLPRNERGKADRAALPIPATSTPFEPPGTIWELIIGDVWKATLGVVEVGLHDDFFELGGDSLAAEELCSRLAADYGLKTDPNALIGAPTLLEFVQRAVYRRRVPPRALVPVKPAGSQPPLFCVAGGGGIGLCFLPLARRLDDERPVWALQAHNLESWGWPDRSVTAMARRNVTALRDVQPTGPYHLLGYSFGGLVSFEMAHRLRAAGEEVAMLILVDSFVPDPRVVVCDGEPDGRLRRTLWRARTAASTLVPTTGRGHYIRFYRQSAAASRRYRGAAWDGRTLVLASREEALPGRGAAWESYLTGPWSLAIVPGRHEALLREPFVADVATHVTAALCAVSQNEP